MAKKKENINQNTPDESPGLFGIDSAFEDSKPGVDFNEQEIKKDKKVKSKVEIKDGLAEEISKSLSKQFKDQTSQMVYFLGEETSPTDVKDWISTGSSTLDLAISNIPNGGIPVGRITELTGLEGCVTEDTIIDVIIE